MTRVRVSGAARDFQGRDFLLRCSQSHASTLFCAHVKNPKQWQPYLNRAQELWVRVEVAALTSLMVSVDVKQYWTQTPSIGLRHPSFSYFGGRCRKAMLGVCTEPCLRIGHSLPLICQPTSEDVKLYIIISHTRVWTQENTAPVGGDVYTALLLRPLWP